MFAWADHLQPKPAKASRTGAFTDNMKLPIHRWFRYSAGFSADWVAQQLKDRSQGGQTDLLFDPFAGSGTALVAAQRCGVASVGVEQHTFVNRIARAKLNWDVDLARLDDISERTLSAAKSRERAMPGQTDLLTRCYTPEALARLLALRDAFVTDHADNSPESELIWLAITSMLRECSGVGTAQWQYVLPNKSKAKVIDPYMAFQRRVETFGCDLAEVRARSSETAPARLEHDDARTLADVADLRGRITFVITSPPYPNNYDYADATRLEMTFWGDVASWGDLHRAVRHRLVRSCSQHSAADRLRLDEVLDDPVLEPIIEELRPVTSALSSLREQRAGRKTYDTMIAAYFADLGRVWRALRPLCVDGADVCFVVGDSAPYGIHVPVERWLAELAVAAGFRDPRFDKVRDRNTKWKNRKHRVPLKEGNLWLKA